MIAAWGTAYLQGHVSLEPVIDHVVGDRTSMVRQSYTLGTASNPWDEPPPPDVEVVAQGEAITFGELLQRLRQRGVTRLHAAFPLPGNADGIGPGPGQAAAYESGSAAGIEDLRLLVTDGDSTEDALDLAVYTNPSRTHYISVSEAQLELTEALQHATSLLSDLDVVSWNSSLRARTGRVLRDAAQDVLPAVCPPRASHLLLRAEQVSSVLDLSADDPTGGAVTGHEARGRDAALAPLRRHVTRALSAAYNSVPH